jgi:hypothetical protein
MRKQYFVWLGLMFVGVSCVQVLDGAYEYKPLCSEDPTCNEGLPCNEDANCDDKDQCTVNLCGGNKTCEYKPVDGLAAEQKAGDCQQGFCAKGVFTQNPDDMDLPDDLESCTIDSCANGAKVHEKLVDGTSCSFGDSAGLCKEGKCTIECGPQKPCNDGNPLYRRCLQCEHGNLLVCGARWFADAGFLTGRR